jgi:hypothetical protein
LLFVRIPAVDTDLIYSTCISTFSVPIISQRRVITILQYQTRYQNELVVPRRRHPSPSLAASKPSPRFAGPGDIMSFYHAKSVGAQVPWSLYLIFFEIGILKFQKILEKYVDVANMYTVIVQIFIVKYLLL